MKPLSMSNCRLHEQMEGPRRGVKKFEYKALFGEVPEFGLLGIKHASQGTKKICLSLPVL